MVKFCRPCNYWPQIIFITAIQEPSTSMINVNDYVEHRAEVLQTYAQKL